MIIIIDIIGFINLNYNMIKHYVEKQKGLKKEHCIKTCNNTIQFVYHHQFNSPFCFWVENTYLKWALGFENCPQHNET